MCSSSDRQFFLFSLYLVPNYSGALWKDDQLNIQGRPWAWSHSVPLDRLMHDSNDWLSQYVRCGLQQRNPERRARGMFAEGRDPE